MNNINQKIPEGWSVKKLGECFSFLKTPSYSRAETTSDGEVHYIHYGDIHTKYPLHVCPEDIDIFVTNKQAQKGDFLQTGDLILLDASEDYDGTTKCIELTAIKDSDKVISGLHTLALRDNYNNFVNGFRAYITSMPFVKNNFWKQVTGIKVYGVSKDNLKKLKLLLPPLAEQKKIAGVLGTWDEAIKKLSSLIEQKKLLKKGLMQKLLTGKTRLKDFTQPWKEVKLGDFIKFQTGFPFNSEFFNQKGIGIRLIKNRDLKSDDQIYFYSGVYSKDFVVQNDDILVGMDGDFLQYLWDKGTALLNQRVGRVLCKNNLKHDFARYILSSPLEKLQNKTASTTVKHLSHTGILKIKVIIPLDTSEQQAIADVLSTVDKEIDLLNKKLEALKEQKKGLMQQLLTGQTRVKVN